MTELELRLRWRKWSSGRRRALALRLAPWLAPRDDGQVVEQHVARLAWVTQTPPGLFLGEPVIANPAPWMSIEEIVRARALLFDDDFPTGDALRAAEFPKRPHEGEKGVS